MDCFVVNKTLLLIGVLSCLLLSTTTAVPSSRPVRTLLAAVISPEINQFCIGTENPTLCAETIAPFATIPFDPVKALEAEIKATLQEATRIAGIISKQLVDPATAKNAKDALSICKSQYGDMLDSIKETLDQLAKKNLVEANNKFNVVLSFKSSCDDAIQESPGVVMPFAQDSTKLFQLGGNCLALMDTISKKPKL
ncbi:unnamed protein product [Sphenostylis stenocarpa]|uniref:Pectinesterase inhibitor domain-containing protein n=1 Tax=Sphenostylis stenocarpa TaxID=92480 RepID=A0AA86SXF8_9FABA|nr:unnamed protein product [Sphenostylis stenocarpa]